MAKKIDWAYAEHLYITTSTMTLRELATRIGSTLATTGKRASAGSWQEKRERHVNEVTVAAAKQTAQRQSKSTSEVASELQHEAEQFKNLARSALVQFMSRSADGVRAEAHRFREVFRVFEGAARLIMLLIGLPTERSVVEEHRTGLENMPDDKLQEWYENLVKGNGRDGQGYPSEDEVADDRSGG